MGKGAYLIYAQLDLRLVLIFETEKRCVLTDTYGGIFL